MSYVILRTDDTGKVTVIGNRHAEPFGNEVNAQRSLTMRSNKNKKRGVTWALAKVEA